MLGSKQFIELGEIKAERPAKWIVCTLYIDGLAIRKHVGATDKWRMQVDILALIQCNLGLIAKIKSLLDSMDTFIGISSKGDVLWIDSEDCSNRIPRAALYRAI